MPISAPRKSVVEKVQERLRRYQHRRQLRRETHHIHGPKHCFAPPGSVVLICLVRNGAYYLDSFLHYYRQLGVEHFVFIDNGSTDETVSLLKQEPNTAILQSHLPWGRFENDLRNLAADRYARDRWCLIVDMDEIFEFEGQKTLGISGLTTWLTHQSFTGVLSQMVEMFPKAPLAEVANMPYAQVLETFDHFDLSTIDAFSYHDPDLSFSYYLQQNALLDGATKVLFGGIRKKVFGENCCLTKHPLVFNGQGTEVGIHPHVSAGVRLAPFTTAIRHYKFANDSLSRDQATVRDGSIGHGEDKQRIKVMAQKPELSLWSSDAQKYTGVELLQKQGFLLTDPAFSAHVASSARKEKALSSNG